jgi:hypothetical protein
MIYSPADHGSIERLAAPTQPGTSYQVPAMRNEAAAKKRKKRGHYCWCCRRIRPNERFCGSGHARHLCRDCSKLDPSELQYGQDLRNLERLVTWEGIIGRKKRGAFNRFLEHTDPRIRRYAEDLAAEDIRARISLRDLENRGCFEPEDDDFGATRRIQNLSFSARSLRRTRQVCRPTSSTPPSNWLAPIAVGYFPLQFARRRVIPLKTSSL